MMKNIIFFFGSFDPLHKGHISIIENAIKKVNADMLYLGLNKNSHKGKLTPFYHRYNMLKAYAKNNEKIKVLRFSFNYQDLENTYKKIFALTNEKNNYYILIGQDQLLNLDKWYNYELLLTKFSFIIAKRGMQDIDSKYLDNPKYLFIDHQYKKVSSLLIKEGKYEYTYETITNYILGHNLYLKFQIKPYLDTNRYNHTLSVAKTALLINKKANLGLDHYKVEKAALLHDIAKNLTSEEIQKIINAYYKLYQNENKSVLHQYVGEYLAKEKFYVYDEEILKAIKYHTTGRAMMSKLEKLIYVADKIEPNRDYNTTPFIKACINNFDKGFVNILKNNKKFLEEKKVQITNPDTLNCFKYYLK